MTLQEIPSIKMNFQLINLSEDRLNSYVKVYHDYKDIWKSNTGDEVRAEREPSKPVKYVVVVMKEKRLVLGNLKKGKRGNLQN